MKAPPKETNQLHKDGSVWLPARVVGIVRFPGTMRVRRPPANALSDTLTAPWANAMVMLIALYTDEKGGDATINRLGVWTTLNAGVMKLLNNYFGASYQTRALYSPDRRSRAVARDVAYYLCGTYEARYSRSELARARGLINDE